MLFNRLAKNFEIMRKPSWIIDLRSDTNPNQLKECNINLWRIGDVVE